MKLFMCPFVEIIFLVVFDLDKHLGHACATIFVKWIDLLDKFCAKFDLSTELLGGEIGLVYKRNKLVELPLDSFVLGLEDLSTQGLSYHCLGSGLVFGSLHFFLFG